MKIHYNVGDVDVETIQHSHKNKLIILKMTMENWGHGQRQKHGMDSKIDILIDDWDRICDLLDVCKTKDNSLTKDEMVEMNFLFKKYGGIRKK